MPASVQADAGAKSSPGWPWRRLLVVALLLALDLWSKSAVFAWLELGPGGARAEGLELDACGHLRFVLLGDWLSLMLSRNPGMAFGQLPDAPWFLVIGRVIAVLVIAWLLVRTPLRSKLYLWAFTLVLAGAMGNLYDNLALEPPPGRPFGEVRDFIDVYFGVWEWHFPTFNVADSCISIGAVLLFVASWRTQPAAKAAPNSSASSAAGR